MKVGYLSGAYFLSMYLANTNSEEEQRDQLASTSSLLHTQEEDLTNMPHEVWSMLEACDWFIQCDVSQLTERPAVDAVQSINDEFRRPMSVTRGSLPSTCRKLTPLRWRRSVYG